MNEKTRQRLLQAAQNVQTRNVINILDKVNKGKSLSARDEKAIESFLSNVKPTEPHPKYGMLPKWASNKVFAATLLNVPHRNYFSKWRSDFNDAPTAQANGSENLWEWFDFIERHNLKGGERYSTDDSDAQKRKAEARKTAAQAKLIEHRVKVLTKEVVSFETARREFTIAAVKLRTALAKAGVALAVRLAMVTDKREIEGIIDDYIRNALDRFILQHEYFGFNCPHCAQEIIDDSPVESQQSEASGSAPEHDGGTPAPEQNQGLGVG